jgi:triacylglycerol lipase
LIASVMASTTVVFAAAVPWAGDAPYSAPTAVLDRALACREGMAALDGDGRAEPVLLVHGTGVTREQNWKWNYWSALPRAGFEVCWVQLPDASLNDAQISAEYVARAVEVMHQRGGELVDVVGHSQGGLVPRWSIKYFPSASFIDDYVGLASPNHGTITADASTLRGPCFESCWQMRTIADFIAALNRGDETPGPISYTSIYTLNDELVKPVETSRLEGGTNILLQDICPGRPTEHALIAADAVAWELTIDALTHPGTADPSRIARGACLKVFLPGANLDFPRDGPDFSGARSIAHEPPLKPYAR